MFKQQIFRHLKIFLCLYQIKLNCLSIFNGKMYISNEAVYSERLQLTEHNPFVFFIFVFYCDGQQSRVFF